MDVPEEIGELGALNTLGTISVKRQGWAVIRKLTQLRRLSVTGVTDQNGSDLCSTLQHFSNLQSLTVYSDDPNGLSRSLLSPLERLQVLKLYGHLSVLPHWVSGLKNLFKLYLRKTKLDISRFNLTNDLGRLPILSILLLLEESIMSPELIFKSDVFRELELLELENLTALGLLSFRAGAMAKLKAFKVGGCNKLEEISVVAGAMSKLEDLQIENCDKLKSVLFRGAGIEMPRLKKLHISGCNNLQFLPFQAGDLPDLDKLLVMHCSNLEVFIESQAVPKLKVLQMSGCRNMHWLPLGAPGGHGLSFKTGAMPNLKTLQIEGCNELRILSFEFGAMRKLEALQIECCDNLVLSFEAGATPRLEILQIKRFGNRVELSGLQHLNLRPNIFE